MRGILLPVIGSGRIATTISSIKANSNMALPPRPRRAYSAAWARYLNGSPANIRATAGPSIGLRQRESRFPARVRRSARSAAASWTAGANRSASTPTSSSSCPGRRLTAARPNHPGDFSQAAKFVVQRTSHERPAWRRLLNRLRLQASVPSAAHATHPNPRQGRLAALIQVQTPGPVAHTIPRNGRPRRRRRAQRHKPGPDNRIDSCKRCSGDGRSWSRSRRWQKKAPDPPRL